jgi:hypothetical protein
VSQEALINDWINDGMIVTKGENPERNPVTCHFVLSESHMKSPSRQIEPENAL